MIKGYHYGSYVDAGLLREHVSKLREEEKLASRLHENIAVMKAAADPLAAYQYDSVLHDIEQMIRYFHAMANLLAQIDDEAVRLSDELRGIIEDSTVLSQRITADSFVL